MWVLIKKFGKSGVVYIEGGAAKLFSREISVFGRKVQGGMVTFKYIKTLCNVQPKNMFLSTFDSNLDIM